ncbi:Acid phosphatase 2, lysosomal, isoform CRA-b [Aphelenchoides bicaudatus]|nr:Acid phosphatase 2, lysosomal, isoform CRA-b [Aphelenchoides bicaudatus]
MTRRPDTKKITNLSFQSPGSVFKHGDRTPVAVWPNDPNQESTWAEGLGQLTAEGFQQHVKLGQKLRQLYGGIFSPEYNSREIYVRSSDVNRTILSAMANMVGFFGEVQNGDLAKLDGWPKNYQPVPIHTVPEKTDLMRALLHKDCARYDELTKLIAQTPEYLKLAEQNKDFLQKLQEITGDHNLSMNDLGLLADTYRIERKIQPIRDSRIYTRDLRFVGTDWIQNEQFQIWSSTRAIPRS